MNALKKFEQSQSLEAGDLAETIASRDHNNLYLTSLLFADQERYRAFCSQYAVMRVIDDIVDAMPILFGSPDVSCVPRVSAMLDGWTEVVDSLYRGEPVDSIAGETSDDENETEALAASLRIAQSKFPVPQSLWSNFFRSMNRDLYSRRFATELDFEDYCEGASAAPTTIYLYLLASRRESDGVYRIQADFPLLTAGSLLGSFAYLAHIIRDMAEDAAHQLVYVSDESFVQCQMSIDDLMRDASRRQSSDRLRELVKILAERSRTSLREARLLLEPHWGNMEADCAVILRLITRVYEATLEKIERNGFEVMNGTHALTPAEKTALLHEAMRSAVHAAQD